MVVEVHSCDEIVPSSLSMLVSLTMSKNKKIYVQFWL